MGLLQMLGLAPITPEQEVELMVRAALGVRDGESAHDRLGAAVAFRTAFPLPGMELSVQSAQVTNDRTTTTAGGAVTAEHIVTEGMTVTLRQHSVVTEVASGDRVGPNLRNPRTVEEMIAAGWIR